MVVTPESFSELPEYATTASLPSSRRPSVQSFASGRVELTSPFGGTLSRVQTDPNVVVLDRFEDASPISTLSLSLPSPGRRSSLPNGFHYLPESNGPSEQVPLTIFSLSPRIKAEDDLVSHFRHYIVRRLVKPLAYDFPVDSVAAGHTKNVFELDSSRFQPVSNGKMEGVADD